MDRKYCCDEMGKTHQMGTDNEGYGSLAYNVGGEITFGCMLKPISFCPWCGARVNAKPVEATHER